MATMACSQLREAWGQPGRMVHALACPAGLGAVAHAERGLPPVPLNVVGEVTSLVALPAPSRAYGRDVGEMRMRERGVRIKMRNRNA